MATIPFHPKNTRAAAAAGLLLALTVLSCGKSLEDKQKLLPGYWKGGSYTLVISSNKITPAIINWRSSSQVAELRDLMDQKSSQCDSANCVATYRLVDSEGATRVEILSGGLPKGTQLERFGNIVDRVNEKELHLRTQGEDSSVFTRLSDSEVEKVAGPEYVGKPEAFIDLLEE